MVHNRAAVKCPKLQVNKLGNAYGTVHIKHYVTQKLVTVIVGYR